MWLVRTVESVDVKKRRCECIDSDVEMTWLPTGTFMRRTENLIAQGGPMNRTPMTTGETVHRSEDERFSSEELNSGAGFTGVESLCSSTEVEAIEESMGKFTSMAVWKHSPEKKKKKNTPFGMNTNVMCNK